MRPSLKIRDFLDQYQHKLQLEFTSRKVGLEREIKLSRQAADTFDAADYFNVIRTSSVVLVGYQESRYIGKLDDSEQEVVRKAASMLGRLGRGNDQVINALVEKLSHSEAAVRLSAVAALDRVATNGSQAAIDKIDELREQEEGRAIWNEFSREALPIQARLRARLGG